MRNTVWTILLLTFFGSWMQASDNEKARLVLGGLDPVLLVEGEERKGDEGLKTSHQGFLYRFANSRNKETFESNPSKFAVQIRGACPVRPDLKGKPEIFLVHQGRIYLFFSEHCRGDFQEDPEGYLEKLPR